MTREGRIWIGEDLHHYPMVLTQERVGRDDTEYVRADIADGLRTQRGALLEALEALVDRLNDESYDEPHYEAFNALKSKIEAAIAKAKGDA